MTKSKRIKYPVDEDEFAIQYAAEMGGAKEDFIYAKILAKRLNEAYYAGIRDGRREKTLVC